MLTSKSVLAIQTPSKTKRQAKQNDNMTSTLTRVQLKNVTARKKWLRQCGGEEL